MELAQQQQYNKNRVNIAFIGGGISTLTFFLHANRNNKIFDLLQREGCMIFDKTRNFGTGMHLEKNVVESNGSSFDYVRSVIKETECRDSTEKLYQIILKEEKFNPKDLNDDNNNNDNKNTIPLKYPRLNEVCMPMFREILETNLFKNLFEYGMDGCPSSLAGYFLKFVGNSLLKHIKLIKNTTLMKPDCEVVGIQLLNDGLINLTCKALKKNDNIKQIKDSKSSGALHIKSSADRSSNANNFETIKTRFLVLSMGSTIKTKKSIFQRNDDIIMNGQEFLSGNGYIKAYNLLSKPISTKRKIILIGESYQAFQSALLLLYGPKIYDTKEEDENLTIAFISKRLKPCEICSDGLIDDQIVTNQEKHKLININNGYANELLSPVSSPQLAASLSSSALINKNPSLIVSDKSNAKNIKTSKPSSIISTTNAKKDNNISTNNNNKDIKQSLSKNLPYLSRCICCGSVIKENFAELYKYMSPLNIKDNEIYLLTHNPVKITFDNIQEAKKYNYQHYTKYDIDNYGRIFATHGLKGPCKNLYLNIMNGQETRVKMMNITEIKSIKDFSADATLIIDCQSFEPNQILIKDHEGKLINPERTSDGYILVDNSYRIWSDRGILKNIYGLGMGYKFGSNDKQKVRDKHSEVSYAVDYTDGIQSEFSFKHQLGIYQSERIIKSLMENIKNLIHTQNHQKTGNLWFLSPDELDPNKSEENSDKIYSLGENYDSDPVFDQPNLMANTLTMFKEYKMDMELKHDNPQIRNKNNRGKSLKKK